MTSDSPQLLLVEEDETLAAITSFRLELLGYRVSCAGTGEAALEQVGNSRPDLMIIDLYLSGIDGLDLINRLRSEDDTAAIPIIVFSIESDLDVVTKAHAAGANDYLVVPYDPIVLQDKIERLLETVLV